jgi:NAD(P)-dependent dehydrogenase (short-subunit alcohol dehydrogenase family)
MADPNAASRRGSGAEPRLALVVGASGGVGRALAEALVRRGEHDRVVALSRRLPEDWSGDHIPLDLIDEASIAAAAEAVRGMGVPVTVIVATGVLHDGPVQPEKSYRALSAEALHHLFAINTIGPALVAKHMLPLMPRGERSLFAALSARVGSIGDNRLGGWYGYRASKAALNMMVKSLAIEHRRTHPQSVCVALHPGTVATGLSAPFAGTREVLTPAQSADALLTVLDGLEPEHTGGFFAWDGGAVLW